MIKKANWTAREVSEENDRSCKYIRENISKLRSKFVDYMKTFVWRENPFL